MMDNKNKPTPQRKTCFRCKRKRYTNKLTLVFVHPVLSPTPILACSATGGVDGCVNETIRDLMLYANTGKLVLVPETQAAVKPISKPKTKSNVKKAKKK